MEPLVVKSETIPVLSEDGEQLEQRTRYYIKINGRVIGVPPNFDPKTIPPEGRILLGQGLNILQMREREFPPDLVYSIAHNSIFDGSGTLDAKVSTIRWLLNKDKSLLDAEKTHPYGKWHPRILSLIISRGPNLNKKDGFLYYVLFRALEYFTQKDFHDLVLQLIDKGYKDVLARKNSGGCSILQRAIFLQIKLKEPTITLLIENGMNINEGDGDGENLLMDAAEKGVDKPYFAMLVRAGANWKATDLNGWTVLHVAVYYKRVTLIKYLLELGADVNAKTFDGQTPLHLALIYARVDKKTPGIVDMLVSAGADVQQKDRLGKNPLYLVEGWELCYWTDEYHKLRLQVWKIVTGKSCKTGNTQIRSR